jgi:branched-chain amino acid transport system substrate-binding protein
MRTNLIACICILVCIAFLLSGCSEQEETQEIKIGLISPLTGPDGDVTEGTRQAAQLAIEEINDAGGIQVGDQKATLTLVVRDNGGEIEKAVAFANELINQHNVIALIGLPFSKNAIPVAKIAQKNGIPMISTVSTHPATTRNKPLVYRVCYTDTFQGKLLAHFVYDDLALDTAAVLYDTAIIYNMTIAEIFRQTFTDLGGTIVAEETYVTGTDDFRPHLKRIASASPELLFLPNYLSDLRIQVRQMRELGLQTTLLGSDTMGSPRIEDAKLFENGFFSTHFSAQNPSSRVQTFVQRFEENYNSTPNSVAALTYDAVHLLAKGLQLGEGSDSAALAKGLAKITHFEGITGSMEFSGDGNPRKSGVILHWRGGKPVFFKQIEPN